MTPQELKASILQLAIQGKLVEQRPEEGTGEELYQQIQQEKQKLIKGKEIKKEKLFSEITEDEIPFEIPESWKWIRLGGVAEVLGGKRIPAGRKLSTDNTGHKYIRVSDMKNETILLDGIMYVPQDIYPSISKYIIKKEDVYITVAGTIGRVGKVPCELDGANLTEDADRLIFTFLDQEWLIKTLQSGLIQAQIAQATTQVGQPKLAIKRIQDLLLPLPPLAEQKRIVAKIEELLPYIERYEQAWRKLEDFNKRFPVDMQKSILQMAVQGKLVEQRPEEGTGEELYQQIQHEKQKLIKAGKNKKEKPLPEISEDEKPFEIPESWKWVRFGSLYSLTNGTASRGTKGGKDRPVLRLADLSMHTINTENVRKISLLDKEFDAHQIQNDDLVFIRVNGSKNRVASAFHYTGTNTLSYCDHLFCGHKYSELIDAEFIMFIFNCPFTRLQLLPEIKTTAGQNTISQSSMAQILLPLPPLAEQKRIVAKLEEILPLCERLK